MLLPTVTRFSALRTIPRFLERKRGKELSAKLRFASTKLRRCLVDWFCSVYRKKKTDRSPKRGAICFFKGFFPFLTEQRECG